MKLTIDTMMELAYAEAKERYPVEMATRSDDERRRIVVRVCDELFPKSLQVDLCAAADIDRYIDEEVQAGNLIPLPGNRIIEAKNFFSLPIDEQRQLRAKSGKGKRTKR